MLTEDRRSEVIEVLDELGDEYRTARNSNEKVRVDNSVTYYLEHLIVTEDEWAELWDHYRRRSREDG